MSEILTAESDRGRAAVEQFMKRARKKGDLGDLPGEWVRVVLQADRPVALVAIDPNRQIAYPRGEVRYAFIRELATLPGRSGLDEALGDLLEAAIADLRGAGMPWIIGRVPYKTGRDFGLAAFTHYSGFILRPEEIEQTLGGGRPEDYPEKLAIQHDSDFQDDLLLVTDVKAETEQECIDALREAAWEARSNGKARILFEHPPAASPGSRYPIHPARQTQLTVMAMACGARIRVVDSGSEAEGDELGQTVATDMVRMVDLPELVAQVIEVTGANPADGPEGAVALDVASGQATLKVAEGRCEVFDKAVAGVEVARFLDEAVAQIISGFRSATTQAYLDDLKMERPAQKILDTLFPRFWRFSRNEKWLLRQWAKV